MTLRPRTSDRPRRRSPIDSEDRFQFWVTVGFISLIVAVIVILVAAVAVNYYNAHFKPVATIEGTTITRDQWADRTKLTLFRIDRASNRVREALAASHIDEATASQQLQSLSEASNSAETQAIEDLIDLTFQEKLAQGQGVTVSDEEVQAAFDAEASTPERRRVHAIFVEPEVDPVAGEPTPEQDEAARELIEKGQADLADGFPFEQVARQYSTDISKERDGDYGIITDENPSDVAWVEALFELQAGETTEIIKGADGIYRIGRVSEILPAADDPFFETELTASVSLDVYRANVRREETSRKLRDKITDEAIAGDVEQIHLAEIFIEQNPNEDEAAGEGVIHASHILFSPNDDPAAAADLPDDDPAWAAAEEEGKALVAGLGAISDIEDREAAFVEAALESDDEGSAATGGDLGFFPRTGQYVQELTDPLFDDPDLQPGDVVGPFKSDFGHHVVLFQERRAPTEERIQEVEDRLAEPEADFAEIARELSDADEAADGGDIGWQLKQQLPADAADEIFELAVGEVTGGFALEDGFHVYKVLEREVRPLEPDQVSLLRSTAFDAWYEPQKTQAEDEGRITRDEELFSPAGGVDAFEEQGG
ncbi:MAG: peptidylprolyl isomerase [Chloroflexi bacterium]|nr:peptidylprolyl isomerase [Chloroflexota bacterium]